MESAAVNAPDSFCFYVMINIENISISFGNLTLFRGLDLQVHYGESVCICGGSGSGKSSLLKAVLGFVPLSEGTIKVDGTLLAPRTADHIRKKIAWIPQELALPSEWVSEMVRMPFELKANREAGFNKERLMDYFVSLGLEEKLYDKRVNEVSGGQRQRIMLAVTALLDKPLLVVDEPTSALDPESCLRVINFFKSLCSKGMTILSVSHDKQFAAGCDRLMGTIDIDYGSLGIGLLLMLIPVYFLWHFKTGLLKPVLIGTVRMIIQLFLIGAYLRFLFEWNNPFINFLWVIIMVGVAAETALTRTRLKRGILMIPISIAFFVTVVLVGLYFLGFVLKLDNIFSAQYFIPVFGIIMGNMLGVNVIGLNTYYAGLRREQQLYYFLLGNGATRNEAIAPFVRQALIKAFSPGIANMAVTGLVALPGTMIGQILGGSSPHVAIKYQIMIVVITVVASMLSLMMTIFLASRKSFDSYGRLLRVHKDTKRK